MKIIWNNIRETQGQFKPPQLVWFEMAQILGEMWRAPRFLNPASLFGAQIRRTYSTTLVCLQSELLSSNYILGELWRASLMRNGRLWWICFGKRCWRDDIAASSARRNSGCISGRSSVENLLIHVGKLLDVFSCDHAKSVSCNDRTSSFGSSSLNIWLYTHKYRFFTLRLNPSIYLLR